MYKIVVTNKYKLNLKKAQKRGYNLLLLEQIVDLLSKSIILPPKYKNHPLKGSYKGLFDCHIMPDWLLIYAIDTKRQILLLYDIGTHSDLFIK